MLRLTRLLARLIAALCVGYFALWACAPPAAMPPPVPHAAGSQEAGFAASGGASIYPRSRCESERSCLLPFVDGMAWMLFSPSDRLSLTPIAFSSTSGSAGGGLLLRRRFNQAERFFVGAEVGFGWAWLSLGLPMSVAVTDRLWLYTRPGVGTSIYGSNHLPAGATWTLGGDWRLNAELGYRSPGGTSYGARTVYGALGFSRDY